MVSQDVILVCVVGMSPAILTETIWALAHEKKPLIPHKVFVLTTTQGRDALERELFSSLNGSSGWSRLIEALRNEKFPVGDRLRFGLASDHVRLFPSAQGDRDVSDIATSEDNSQAADFILQTLREFTERTETVVLASIAGGRKTMGALMMSCMSLLGREQDRVLHVLVNPPFDGVLNPTFLFPEKKASYKTRDGNLVKEKPAIELIDVPFVRMRGWYEGAFKSAPPSYAALVKGVQKEIPAAKNYPILALDCKAGTLTINGQQQIELSPMEFVTLLFILTGTHEIKRLIARFKGINTQTTPQTPDWLCKLFESSRFKASGEQEISKVLSSARAKLSRCALLNGLSAVIIPRRALPTTYPQKKITVFNRVSNLET